WDRAARIAGGLRVQGIARGDRVAVQLGNGLDWCLAFFGAQLAGAIAVPVNTRFNAAEAAYVIADSGARFHSCPVRRCLTGRLSRLRICGATNWRRSFTQAARRAFPKAR